MCQFFNLLNLKEEKHCQVGKKEQILAVNAQMYERTNFMSSKRAHVNNNQYLVFQQIRIYPLNKNKVLVWFPKAVLGESLGLVMKNM